MFILKIRFKTSQELLFFVFKASNSLELIWRTFSFIFQAPPILWVSKFALQEYGDKSPKYLTSNESKEFFETVLCNHNSFNTFHFKSFIFNKFIQLFQDQN